MTATGAAAALQQGLYTHLTGVLSIPVYDAVPEPARYPYVVIGEVTETPANTHDLYRSELVLLLHVWTRYDGYAQGLAIAGELRQLLDHQHAHIPLPEVGGVVHRLIALVHEQTRTMRDPDPEIRHVPVRFRAVTEQTRAGP